MLSLIIKGDPEQAQVAAKRYGLRLKTPMFYVDRDETHADVEDGSMVPVQEWFCEPFSPSQPGTLLYWRIK